MAGPADESNDPREREEARAAQVAAARSRFAALVQLPDSQIDLAEAALLIAAEEFPDLDIRAYLGRLDALAGRVRERIEVRTRGAAPGDADEVALAELHSVLFEEEGFHGAGMDNAGEYYRARNSFLNEVLDRKQGLPILLSLVYCEVARRAGLDAVGISAPMHFIAQFRGRHMSVLVDPYNRGARVPPESLAPEVIVPAPRKAILERILTNLKLLYVQRQQYLKAWAVVERMLAIRPLPAEVRDRGLILRALGEQLLREGRERFLREQSGSPEAAERAMGSLRSAMQHSLHLLGSSWLDLDLYARVAEGDAQAGEVGQSAMQLWRQLGRNN